jgi:hypothetical protein
MQAECLWVGRNDDSLCAAPTVYGKDKVIARGLLYLLNPRPKDG